MGEEAEVVEEEAAEEVVSKDDEDFECYIFVVSYMLICSLGTDIDQVNVKIQQFCVEG